MVLITSDWLPESDSRQNDSALYIEFPFGQLNSTKGAKRLLPIEAFAAAKTVRVKRSANWTAEERRRLTKKCRALLAAHPALTRRALAEQLKITTSWLNHLLKQL